MSILGMDLLRKSKNKDQVADVYDYIYSHSMGLRGIYGGYPWRERYFMEFLLRNVPKGSRIADLGCGRGFLLRWLVKEGYEIFGTEIAPSLFKKGGELYGLPVKRMKYEELVKIKKDSFDAVISNDVIEHVPTTEDVENALINFSRISRKYVLLSSGGMKASRNPFAKELGPGQLHTVIKPKTWWKEIFTKYFELSKEIELPGDRSYFLFGRVKQI